MQAPHELLIHPEEFTGRIAGFGYQYLAFEARTLAPGEVFHCDTDHRELAIVVLGGRCSSSHAR